MPNGFASITSRQQSEALVEQQRALADHEKAIQILVNVSQTNQGRVDALAALVARSFWGRLRWLVLGR
jgi:hypothetical protein